MSAIIPRISAKEFIDLFARGEVIALDCTIDRGQRDGTKHFLEEHIKGARYFPYLDLCTEGQFPSTMPDSVAEFVKHAGELGIKSTDKLVVYDRQCFFGSPRAAFMLATYAHPNVYCLDSYEEYKRLGGKVESGPDLRVVEKVEYASAAVVNEIEPKQWFKLKDIVDLYESKKVSEYNLIDVRAPERYAAGHLLHAVNIFFQNAVENKKFKPSSEVKELLKDIDVTKPTVVYCNSGITACILKTAIDEFLLEPAFIYDGSWSEYSEVGPKEYTAVGN